MTKERVTKLSEEWKGKFADALSILGKTFPATEAGFSEHIVYANVMELNGYELVSLVRLDTKIAATYKRRPIKKEVRYTAAFDADEGDDVVDDGTTV